MNISSHCFVPRGQVLDGKYYTLLGNLSSNVQYVATTEKQIGDIYNSFQLFGSYVPFGTWYALRLFEPAEGSPSPGQGENYVGKATDGYVSPIVSKTAPVYTSSAYTMVASTFAPYVYAKGFPVCCIMWYEVPDPVVLSLGSTLSPDIIVNLEEAL